MSTKKLALIFLILILTCFACADRSGISKCATALTYTTNRFTSGEHAINHSSEYHAELVLGSNKNPITALLDTASGGLVVNGKDFVYGEHSARSRKPYFIGAGQKQIPAIGALDVVDVACTSESLTRFSITSKSSNIDNILGLGFNDPVRRPHEKRGRPFFDQLVKRGAIRNEFSVALCANHGNSRVVLGGIDDDMAEFIGDFIPIIDQFNYAVPALNLKRADNKQLIGHFPAYDRKKKSNRLVIIDTATSVMLFSPDMAKAVAELVKKHASSISFKSPLPKGFFRTERSSSTKVVRFKNLKQIRSFPTFELNFLGADKKIKSLELSALHYFKEIDNQDPLLRSFAIRETNGDIILGQPFIENHYLYFDRKNGRIGFGNIDVACAN